MCKSSVPGVARIQDAGGLCLSPEPSQPLPLCLIRRDDHEAYAPYT